MAHWDDTDIRCEKPILVIGKAGAGKTEKISHCVSKCVRMHQNVLVAARTGFLANRFQAILPDEVTCETEHSTFHISVNVNEWPSTNWNLSHYDIIVIDEISMISENNFQHILNTSTRLIFRPVLMVCGNYAQQQPFEKLTNRIAIYPVHWTTNLS
jgi:ATP-dependent exoDNAse (exonuclease V) alpha subunit